MISNQIIRRSIEELQGITKVELGVFSVDGAKLVSTFEAEDLLPEVITDFAGSSAESQVIGKYHLLKVKDEEKLVYIVVARGEGENGHMIGKVAVCQLQNLFTAYKEKVDHNSFFQNLLLDNLLLVDVYNRARKLHIEAESCRVIILIETKADQNRMVTELLKTKMQPPMDEVSHQGLWGSRVSEKAPSILIKFSASQPPNPSSLQETQKHPI